MVDEVRKVQEAEVVEASESAVTDQGKVKGAEEHETGVEGPGSQKVVEGASAEGMEVPQEATVVVDAAVETAEAGAVPEEVAALKAEVERLRVRLSEVEAQAAEYLDGWKRAQASFANYRKRMDAERETLQQQANAALVTRLLPVLDDFQRAFEAVPDEMREAPWLEGITLIRRKLLQILEAEGVEPIPLEPGDPFDPLYHQAVFYQETTEVAEGHVVEVTQRGYMLRGRVLRPSMVVVAKPPVPPVEESRETDREEADAEGTSPASPAAEEGEGA